MDQHLMDGETAATLAGVVRLLRRAAELEWGRSDAEGPRSARQLSALGIDVVAGDFLDLLPGGGDLDGPVPPGDDPAAFLRSAQSLLLTLAGGPDPSTFIRLAGRVGDLEWEVSNDADH
jgi:hypothetical protein